MDNFVCEVDVAIWEEEVGERVLWLGSDDDDDDDVAELLEWLVVVPSDILEIFKILDPAPWGYIIVEKTAW